MARTAVDSIDHVASAASASSWGIADNMGSTTGSTNSHRLRGRTPDTSARCYCGQIGNCCRIYSGPLKKIQNKKITYIEYNTYTKRF